MKYIVNVFILLVSLVVGLLLCELGSRIFLDPVDYLSPSTVRDNIMGFAISPKSGGHDEWGFRNQKVPLSSEIVALGDSHTYGQGAKMSESWPHVLGRLTEKTVYNLGLGGYGPNQYFYLFNKKAISLKPRIILCGLYLGDDFDNAFEITYGLDNWKYLRSNGFNDNEVLWDIWEKQIGKLNWNKKIRNWLSRNSIIYRLLVHSLLDRFKGEMQIKAASGSKNTSTLSIREKNIQEAFLPKSLLKGLDQENSNVREGMRITLNLLQEMNMLCNRQNIRFIVAIIPTKESSFTEYLENNPKLLLSEYNEKVIKNEQNAKKIIVSFFRNSNLEYIDLLPIMKYSINREKLYSNSAVDMHPNRNGYRVMAEEIAVYIKLDRISN